MADVHTEYACRFTGYAYDPETRDDKQATVYDMAGFGETGLEIARAAVRDTRAWQERRGLPVDAVVVYRNVSEWTVHEETRRA